MKLLVLITVYKRSYLEAQLKALENQTLKPDYLVVYQNENHINIEPLKDKLLSFGWDVFDIDGHKHDHIKDALTAKATKPKFIIANTIKGKGVSFMENKVVWHYRSANEDELSKGLKELEE